MARHKKNYVSPHHMVGVTGFEPATSSSRTKRATKLRHTPILHPSSGRRFRISLSDAKRPNGVHLPLRIGAQPIAFCDTASSTQPFAKRRPPHSHLRIGAQPTATEAGNCDRRRLVARGRKLAAGDWHLKQSPSGHSRAVNVTSEASGRHPKRTGA